MIRFLALTALALILAIGGGTASVWVALNSHEGFGAQQIGPWTTRPADDGANPYATARRAREAQLPLGIGEGVVFHARHDEDNRLLRGDCSYVLEGNAPAARFWTLHVAGLENGATVPGRAAGLHSRQILRRADSSLAIAISARPMPGNWIAAPAGMPFVLVLTLFDTPVASTLRATEQIYPVIRRTGCV